MLAVQQPGPGVGSAPLPAPPGGARFRFTRSGPRESAAGRSTMAPTPYRCY